MNSSQDELRRQQFEFIHIRSKSWHIFEGNYKELCDSCDVLANPEKTYTYEGARHVMHQDAYTKMLDAERKFHNFLASAKTLVDHTRVLMRKYSHAGGHAVFQQKLEALKKSPIISFCHELRNYFLHQENPVNNYFVSATFYEHDNLTVYCNYVRISKESLLDFSGWSTKSKVVISKMETPLEIKEVATLYFNEVLDINNWLNNNFAVLLAE